MSKNKPLIAAVDAGTTGVRCCIFDMQGNETAGGYYRVPTSYPRPGWVEQDAETVTELAYKAVASALSGTGADAQDIIGLCITAQRNGFVPVDAKGSFLSGMFIWQDQRGAAVHPWMRRRLHEHGLSPEAFYRINGQPFGTFQAGNKVIWLSRFRKDLYDKAYKLVTPLAFLMKAFGAEAFFDEKNDTGFLLVADADTQKIDRELCNIFGLDADKFPESVLPGTKVGTVSAYAAGRTGLSEGTPIYAGSGDQQCGALGAGNYGTPSVITLCMGTAGLCIGYSPEPVRHPGGKCNIQGHPAGGYTVEGHSSSCMSSFAWTRDMLFPGRSGEANFPDGDSNRLATESAMRAPAGSNGIIFLPWLQGAECPHYDETARGAFIGMSLATGKDDMIRACMEGICFENRMMIETLRETGIPPVASLRLLGGASNNAFWNQMQADIYGLPVETVTAKECTALGAAIICAVASGLYGSYEKAVTEMVRVRRQYTPDPSFKSRYDEVFSRWDSCYRGLCGAFIS